MTSATDFIVELRNVSKRYGEHTALEDFSLGVGRGEFLTLLGPSGSGKTTLLRIVAGFEQPQSGQVLIDGHDASSLPPYRRNVNTVFQHYALFPHLDVRGNVAFGLEEKKLSRHEVRRRVRSILELVDLPGKEDRFPHQLSGGEKQRVALARALVLEPAVLLLDEPLGALDQRLRRQMQVELKRLRQQMGISFIFVTHDQEEALVMSDRVAIVNRGRLEQLGSGEEIYERPGTRFVAGFMGVENFFEARCASRGAEASGFETAAGLRLWATGCSVAEGDAVTLAVRPESARLETDRARLLDGPVNALAGEVVEAIYEGGSRRWAVRLASGELFVVREPSGRARSETNPIKRGAQVRVMWEAAKSLVYPGKLSQSDRLGPKPGSVRAGV